MTVTSGVIEAEGQRSSHLSPCREGHESGKTARKWRARQACNRLKPPHGGRGGDFSLDKPPLLVEVCKKYSQQFSLALMLLTGYWPMGDDNADHFIEGDFPQHCRVVRSHRYRSFLKTPHGKCSRPNINCGICCLN